jgi:hypothetical protein
MTDSSKEPKNPGLQSGSQSGKRPSATIDLRATEIERRDIPGTERDAAAADAASMSAADSMIGAESPDMSQSAGTADAPADAIAPSSKNPQSPPDPPSAEPPRPAASARRSGGVGGFVTHMLAGIVGAGIAIFGADYLANTFGLSIPTYSAVQTDQLTHRIADLEQTNKEHAGDTATSFAREQLNALKVKADQTAAAVVALGSVQADEKQLADRTAKLELALGAQPQGGGVGDRVAKLEDQFKTLTLAGAAGQAGNVGTMAALIAKVESMGATLDSHLDETRKSLQGDLQKQSAHFEERLSEVDKSMSVDTLKASGKAMSDQLVALRADGDKLHQDIATVAAGNDQLRKDLVAEQQSTADLKAKIQSDAATFAKSQQLSDVNATATKLQTDVAAIAAKDKAREEAANRILLTLQLANLRRAVEGGGGYAKELTEAKRLAPVGIDLTALDASADKGLPANTLLLSQFKDLTWKILGADSKSSGDGSLLGELWQGARSVVQVRRTDVAAGDSTEAILARTEDKLQSGDLGGTMREIAALKGDAQKIAAPWVSQLAGRLAVDQAIAKVDAGLAKLMGPAASTTTN